MENERRLICVNRECTKKGKPQREESFYNSRVEGMDKYPLCKTCIKDLLIDDDMIQVLKLLKAMNYPYYPDVWEKAKSMSPTNPFGTYVSKIGTLAQYKDKTWEDGMQSLEEPDEEMAIPDADDRDLEDEESDEEDSFGEVGQEEYEVNLTPEEKKELIKKFGHGYNDEMLVAMNIKYEELKVGYPDSPLHRESLTNYVKYKVQEETCIANGDYEGAEMWSKLAQKQADIAKLNPKQISEKDLDDGLNAISTLSLMVEKGIDIIPIMPQYKAGPRDLPDFLIYCLTERLREEKGMKPVSYKEVYEWYDKKRKDWLKTYGDDKDAIAESDKMQRKIAEKFIREADEINHGESEK